jgi:hypothetical protein
MQAGTPELWAAVDRLVERAPGLADLRAHRLHLIAAARGGPFTGDLELRAQRRVAAINSLLAPVVLARARAAYDGRLMLIKGPEVAARYPDPAVRPFRDLDLLADDAEAAQRGLLAAGFEPVGFADDYYAARHHLRPLMWPGTPLVVEVHCRPEWPRWSRAPAAAELFAAAVPSALTVDGLLAPAPAHHALIVAGHSWSAEPLRLLLDLVDIAALTAGLDPAATAAQADHWGIGRAWRTLAGAADALLGSGPPTWPLRSWARNLGQVRDRTVLESHVADLLGSFWAVPLRRAPRVCAMELSDAIGPVEGEPLRGKLARAGRALRNASTPLAVHHAAERSVHLPDRPAPPSRDGFPVSGLQERAGPGLRSAVQSKEREKRR